MTINPDMRRVVVKMILKTFNLEGRQSRLGGSENEGRERRQESRDRYDHYLAKDTKS